MRENMSNGRGDPADGGYRNRGPRRETTIEMSAGRLMSLDPGSKLDRRAMTQQEREWLNSVSEPTSSWTDVVPDTEEPEIAPQTNEEEK